MNAKRIGSNFEDHLRDHIAKYLVSIGFILISLSAFNWLNIRDLKYEMKNAVPRLIYEVNISDLNLRTEQNQKEIERLQNLWDAKYSTNKTRGAIRIPHNKGSAK